MSREQPQATDVDLTFWLIVIAGITCWALFGPSPMPGLYFLLGHLVGSWYEKCGMSAGV